MKLKTLFTLGRVSNLPTVWTNVAAGVVLAGATPQPQIWAALIFSISLFYIGGMYINDAFDAQWDKENRPERPIPSGKISRAFVMISGFSMLTTGTIGAVVVGMFTAGNIIAAGVLPIALFGCIVLYDRVHKATALSPIIMGLCRALVYITCGIAAGGTFRPMLFIGAAALLFHVVGLSFVAKNETLSHVKKAWPLLILAIPIALCLALAFKTGTGQSAAFLFAGWTVLSLFWLLGSPLQNIGRTVVSLIAAIALLDGCLIALMGKSLISLIALALFVFTLILQKFIKGT
jgi:4-hydroxybenzoate polyprenyltransferase